MTTNNDLKLFSVAQRWLTKADCF